MGRVPISFVVAIAEGEIGGARFADQRDVNHFAGIARIQGASDHSLIGGEDRGVDPDTESQGENCGRGEPGVAIQHAGPITHVLEYGFWQDHQIDLSQEDAARP